MTVRHVLFRTVLAHSIRVVTLKLRTPRPMAVPSTRSYADVARGEHPVPKVSSQVDIPAPMSPCELPPPTDPLAVTAESPVEVARFVWVDEMDDGLRTPPLVRQMTTVFGYVNRPGALAGSDVVEV